MIQSILRTQWTLLLRSHIFWVVTVGSVALSLLATRGGSVSYMLMMFAEMAAPFFYLAQMLVSTFVAQRERTEHVEELIEVMPYRPVTWIMSRYLLLFAIWLVFTALLWLIGALMVLIAGHPLDVRLLLVHWLTVVPATVALTTAVGFVLGSVLRRGVIAYFLTTLAWLSGPVLMVLLSKGSNRLPVPILEYFASGRAFPITMAGWYPNGELLLWNRLFALGAAGVLLTLLIWLGARRRALPRQRTFLVLLLCAAIALGAAGRSQQIWSNRYAAYDAEVASLPRAPVAQPTALRTDHYHLHIALQPDQHRVAVQGAFDLHNPGPESVEAAELTLRHNFAITALHGPDGQPLPFDRRDDWLTVQVALAPGETIRLTAAWEGEVYHWRLRDGPKLGAHVAADSFFLPAHYGWYPIPGRFTPSIQARDYMSGTNGNVAVDMLPPHHPASFEVTVSGSGLHLVHNAGHPVPGFYLLGTPYDTFYHGDIAVTVSPINRAKGALLAQEARDVFAFFHSLIPLETGPLRIVETHDNAIYGDSWDGDRQAAPGTLLVHNIDFGQVTEGYLTQWNPQMIVRLWWPVRYLVSEQAILYQDLVAYMLHLWQVETGTEEPHFGRNASIQILLQIEESLGRETSVQILRELHALRATGGPTEADFEAVLRRVVGYVPEVAKPLPVFRR